MVLWIWTLVDCQGQSGPQRPWLNIWQTPQGAGYISLSLEVRTGSVSGKRQVSNITPGDNEKYTSSREVVVCSRQINFEEALCTT